MPRRGLPAMLAPLPGQARAQAQAQVPSPVTAKRYIVRLQQMMGEIASDELAYPQVVPAGLNQLQGQQAQLAGHRLMVPTCRSLRACQTFQMIALSVLRSG